MKRSVKALLVSGVMAASVWGTAAPAGAATCVGVEFRNGFQNAGAWTCTCPSDPKHGPIDGQFWLILCV
ncbi:MAG TPA: hypothetical protein VEV43_04740 [Actinomycetota bacterium]|nr:hypothetical protein [Actinomycetota bacterium]